MKSSVSHRAWITSCLISTIATAAHAQTADRGVDESTSAARRQGPSNQDFHFNGGFGVSHDADVQTALVHSVIAGYRFHFVEAGVTGDVGTAFSGPRFAMGGVYAGPVLQTDFGARLSLSGVFGANHYSSIDCGMFCKAGGASATLPYAGARLGGAYVWRSGSRSHLELGAYGFYGRDLDRAHVAYTTSGRLLGSGGGSDERTLGGARVGALLTVGITVDTVSDRVRYGRQSARR